MKKTIVLILACLLCLTACGKKDTTVTPTPTATATMPIPQNITLNIP